MQNLILSASKSVIPPSADIPVSDAYRYLKWLNFGAVFLNDMPILRSNAIFADMFDYIFLEVLRKYRYGVFYKNS